MTQTFADLGLSASTLEAITKKGFEEPTEIQAKAIPLLLNSDQDIIAQAQTGTGKTATFGLVFTEKLIPGKSKNPQAIVLAPTRELAVQIAEELNSLKGDKKLSIVPIYGGQSWGMQTKHLRSGVDIVVGTPGRVMEHLQKKTLNMSEADYFVLDEADEMLNMGFIDDIEEILKHTKPERKTLLFSATMPRRIADLAKKYMTNAINIKTEKDKIANNAVDQIYFEVHRQDKFDALCRIIDMEDEFYGIIFCRTKIDSDDVNKHLNDRGYRAEAFHGDVSQDRRNQILRNFRDKKTDILVATDVAARGIDVKDLTHVINHSLPQNSESYVHRIGRTGRAGKEGKAITLITPAEYRKLRMFEQHAKAKIEKKSLPDAAVMVDLKKQKLLKDIEKILEDPKELKRYEDMTREMFDTKNPDIHKIIAALLKLSFSETLDIQSYKTIQAGGRRDDRGRDRDRGDQRDRTSSSDGARDQFGNARLFLTTGKNDGASVPKILNMIENEFGVSGKVVGNIDIMEGFSFISVPLKEAEEIMDAFHKMKQGGQRPSVRVERAAVAKRSGGGGRRSGGSAGGGGRGHKGGSRRR